MSQVINMLLWAYLITSGICLLLLFMDIVDSVRGFPPRFGSTFLRYHRRELVQGCVLAAGGVFGASIFMEGGGFPILFGKLVSVCVIGAGVVTIAWPILQTRFSSTRRVE